MSTRRAVTYGDREWTVNIDGASVTIDGVPGAYAIDAAADGHVRVSHDDASFTGVAATNGHEMWVSIQGHALLFKAGIADSRSRTAASSRALRGVETIVPPMSATVVRILVKEGDAVHEGDTLLVLEAMKMELPIRASHDAVVARVGCREGELVQPDTVLIELK